MICYCDTNITFFLKCHQFQFLRPGKLLDGIFSPHGFFFRSKSLAIDQRYRSFVSCISGAVFSLIMSLQALFQTVCPSRIKRSVCTANHISIIHKLLLLRSFHDRNPKKTVSCHLYLCKGGPLPYMTAVLPFSIKSNRPETYISHTGHMPGKEKAGRRIPIADFAFPPALLYVLFLIL